MRNFINYIKFILHILFTPFSWIFNMLMLVFEKTAIGFDFVYHKIVDVLYWFICFIGKIICWKVGLFQKFFNFIMDITSNDEDVSNNVSEYE